MTATKNFSDKLAGNNPIFNENSRESRVLDNIRGVIFELDQHGCFAYLNRAWVALTGHNLNTTLGNPLGAYVHPDDAASYAAMINRVLSAADTHSSVELRLLHKSGQCHWVDLSIDARQNGHDKALYGHIKDIGDPSVDNAPLNYTSARDSVTGAYNRHHFERKLQELIRALGEQSAPHSLLYLELLNFKLINQALSHHDGDIVLREIAALLSSCLKSKDLLCRIDGYEFALLLHRRGDKAAGEIANRIIKLLSNYRYNREPFSFIVGGNIGIRQIDKSNIKAAQYIADAVKATAVSKTLGRNRSYLFSQQDDGSSHNHGCDWNHRIHEAIQQDHLQLYLQPIRDIENREINHYEALLRIVVAETGEIVRPEQFIDAIERTGAIREVDLWVIGNAIKLLSQRPEIQRLAINLSAHAFEDAELLTLIQSQLKHHQVAAQRVILELTETSSLINLEQTHAVIKDLRAIGCQFALDDFGTGFCSFSYLKHLPADYVKLDGSYIKNICNNTLDQAMVRSMNDIAHALGHKTIAECVESAQAIELLSDIGVDYIQGYSVGRPSPSANHH